MPQSASELSFTSSEGIKEQEGGRSPLYLLNKEITEQLENQRLRKQAVLWENCGKERILFYCDCGWKNVPRYCNQYRICEGCGYRYRQKIKKKFLAKLKKRPIARKNYHRGIRHLTLSYRPYSSLRAAIVRGVPALHQSIKRFLRRKYIKDRVKGGFYTLEFERTDNGWYIHAHCIIDSKYLDIQSHKYFVKKGIKKLARLPYEWKQATEGVAQYVWIRACGNIERDLDYVVKYVTKPPVFNPYQLALYARLMHGKRLMFTFGDFYNEYYTPSVKKNYCENCGANYIFFGFSLDWLFPKTLSLKLLPNPPPSLYEFEIENGNQRSLL